MLIKFWASSKKSTKPYCNHLSRIYPPPKQSRSRILKNLNNPSMRSHDPSLGSSRFIPRAFLLYPDWKFLHSLFWQLFWSIHSKAGYLKKACQKQMERMNRSQERAEMSTLLEKIGGWNSLRCMLNQHIFIWSGRA